MVGGANFVAVKYSNKELEPTWGAALRFSLATLIFLAIAWLRRVPLPSGRAFVGAALYGLLGFGLAYYFLYYALVGLTAGTSSVMIAAAPLATLVLAVVHRQERFTKSGVFGGLLAIAGIGVLSSGSLGGDLSPLYLLSALLGVLCIAESAVVIKAFPRAHPIATNAVGMAAGAAFLVVTSLLLGDEWTLPTKAETWAAIAWLVAAGSVVLFLLYLYLIERWSASATNYVVTLMPIVAVSLGALLDDESITIEVVLGGLLVLSAVYVGALRQEPPPREESSDALAAEPTSEAIVRHPG
jgi:drug/metabolite transporter (DMT)-like permease